MKSRFAALAATAAAALLLGGACGRKLYPPEFVSVPYSVYAGDTAYVRLVASGSGHDSVRYVVNWDNASDTTIPFGLSDTATIWHVWTEPDTKYVRAAVYSPDDPQGIRWAAQKSVVVEPDGPHAPVVDSILAPPVAVRGETTRFFIYAHDPDGDSMRADAAWNDSMRTTTDFSPDPAIITVHHVFTVVETAKVVVSMHDRNGATSLPDTVYLLVGNRVAQVGTGGLGNKLSGDDRLESVPPDAYVGGGRQVNREN